jgi:hypothetical protein
MGQPVKPGYSREFAKGGSVDFRELLQPQILRLKQRVFAMKLAPKVC